ncbi:hypothetical protein ABE65_011495 [Fictibacillus phosphorivorans]|uniref:N-acetyltransferase domain-containing protein n=1 Tax=Fictibacillus phosphorivorans TaxID=1221500 RepID=A0A160IMG5_9BACL|nr:hypothetical protein [Fictibacillus phosphorivorans]ANC77391.1 hypothetical protein ABE65_011495 [Fictibacillus phosphorivorans]
MNHIDTQHQILKQLFKNSAEISQLKNNSPLFRNKLLNTPFTFKNKSQENYIKWILNKTHFQFFLMPLEKNGIITLVKHNFNSLVGLRFCDDLTPITKKIFDKKYGYAVEVVYLHSFKKGEGSNILRELDNLMIKIEIPLVLYTEKKDLIRFYEERGFVNYGIQGDNKEYLMIKFP